MTTTPKPDVLADLDGVIADLKFGGNKQDAENLELLRTKLAALVDECGLVKIPDSLENDGWPTMQVKVPLGALIAIQQALREIGR